MGKITEALKKVTDERIAQIQKKAKVQYVVKNVASTSLDQHIVAFHDASSPIAEQYNILRTNIRSLKFTKDSKTFVITSAIDSEGKSITSLNLAITMAHDLNNKSVLLIDGDTRRGKLTKYLGLRSQAGLSEILQGKAEMNDVFIDPKIKNLTVMLAGKPPKNPSELLASKKMGKILSELKSNFDYIFIDTPPVMPLTDACIIAPMVDGVIFVVQAGRTQRDMVLHAETRLLQARAKIAGFVITSVEDHLPSYLYRYMHRYDSYHYYGKKSYSEEKELVKSEV